MKTLDAIVPGVLAALLAGGPAMAAVDVDALWNFSDPAASERRFRAALATAAGDDALVLRTQIARTFGLRRQFDRAHAELDAMAPALQAAGPVVRVRADLERGRTLRSAGQAAASRPLFRRAHETAAAAGLDALAADALHMIALVAEGLDERLDWNRQALALARRSADPGARRWAGPVLNNIGNDLRGAGRLAESLAMFQEAQAAYEQSGRTGGARFARWQVANVLRLLGQADEALALQLALERDNAAAGAPDVYVFEELALLYAAKGDAARAAHYRELKARQESRP